PLAHRVGGVDLLQQGSPPQHDELVAPVHLLRGPKRRAAVHPAGIRGGGGAPRARARAVLRHALPGQKPAGDAMRLPPRNGRVLVALAGCLALIAAAVAAGAANSHAQISGSGSSWAYNAVNQWIADTNQRGLQVVFTSTGYATGRQDFSKNTNDFPLR